MGYDNQNRKKENPNQSEPVKTRVVSENAVISQALSEILRATSENQIVSTKKSILFYLANKSTPIMIEGHDLIRIGRSDDKSEIATLNLDKYHGAVLGVSRHHAEIIYKDEYYYIKDLGSTNGTWLNSEKLPPYRLTRIHDEDQLRLGHFNIVVRPGIQDDSAQ